MMSLIMLSVAIAYLINWNGKGLALHWAFLIVFGFYLLLAGLLALVGLRKVKKVRAPKKAIAQAQETKQILKRG
jgi:high-affinity Fe2+/Pb2+ permease